MKILTLCNGLLYFAKSDILRNLRNFLYFAKFQLENTVFCEIEWDFRADFAVDRIYFAKSTFLFYSLKSGARVRFDETTMCNRTFIMHQGSNG